MTDPVFIVECDAGYNLFYLAASGNWTVDVTRAARFNSRARAYRARCKAYKRKGDILRTIKLA